MAGNSLSVGKSADGIVQWSGHVDHILHQSHAWRSERRIMCVGLVCLDIVAYCKNYPAEDVDERCEEMLFMRGGNASNSCTTLSILNANIEFMGTIADNEELNFFKKDFIAHNINHEHAVYVKDSRSATAMVIISSENGSRTIVHSSNDLRDLTAAEFDMIDLKSGGYKWIHFESRHNTADNVKMLEMIDSFNTTQNKNDKILTSVELEKPRISTLPLASKADYVFISKDFARLLGYEDKETAVSQFIHKCRPGASVICAWGELGAAAKQHNSPVYSCPAFPPKQIVSTLAAGDTFNAATIFALSGDANLQDAMAFGCRIAGLKCGERSFEKLKETLNKM